MILDIFYYSNRSGNTKRFVKKLGYERYFHVSEEPLAARPYVLFVPTYGGGNEEYAVPKAVVEFLSNANNVDLLRGIVGFGNRNFGTDYCKAAYIIAEQFGVSVLGTVELFGVPEDVEKIFERLQRLDEQLQLS